MTKNIRFTAKERYTFNYVETTMPVIPTDLFERIMKEMVASELEAAIQDKPAEPIIRPMPLKRNFQTYFGDTQITVTQAPHEPQIDIEAEDDKLTS